MKDLTGKRFGRLVALKYAGSKHKRRAWLCICDCGNLKEIESTSLLSGNTKSCGCLQEEKRVSANTIHGWSKTRLYRIWKGMKSRCLIPSSTDYKWYGARGIKICEEWKSFEPFKEWAINNGYEEHLTIERIDNEKGYSPENCKWATIAEQNKNKRRKIK